MIATQNVQIYDFDGSLVVTTPFQLLQWKHALSLEDKGLTMSGGRKVSTHLRKLLSTPKGYPKEQIRAYISECLDDINGQFETGEFNLEKSV